MRFGEAPGGKLGDGVCDPDNNQELHSLMHYGGAPVSEGEENDGIMECPNNISGDL